MVRLSRNVLRVALSGAALFALLALVFGYTTVSRSLDLSRTASLERENAILAETISQVEARLDALSDTLTTMSVENGKTRLLANLDPLDQQVLQAGIGGPATSGNRPLATAGSLGRRMEQVTVDLSAMIRRANLLAYSYQEAAESLSSQRQRLEATPSIMPTRGWLTSAFSAMREHPILHLARPHEGIDVTAPMGAVIEAPAAGRVVSAGWETGYGNIVTLDHGYGVVTKFAHASKLLVGPGQRVVRGERIALVGNSGLATSPHLHYEVHVNGRPVNPLRYILPDVITE